MRRAGTTGDVVGFLEAAYEVESSTWLDSLVRAAHATFDRGLGVTAFHYDVSRRGQLVMTHVAEAGAPTPIMTTALARAMLAAADESFIEATYRTKAVALASDHPIWDRPGGPASFFAGHGIADLKVVNAMDVSGLGVLLAVYLPKRARLSARDRSALERIAAHVTSANRLRARLTSLEKKAARTPEAVFTARGKAEHLGTRAEASRKALRDAVVAYGEAKGALRRDPSRPGWNVLVDGEWSLLDRFERDGKRFIVAQENAPKVRGPAPLTDRERQIAAYVAMGQENKLIAYTLGISHATVRVLVARATAKLGVKSRAELARSFLAAASSET